MYFTKKIVALLCACCLLVSNVMFAQEQKKEIQSEMIKDIFAFNPISENLVSSGFPKTEQFKKIKEAGVDVVINLIEPTNNEAHPNLSSIYEADLIYYTVPYNKNNPIASMESFMSVMDTVKNKNVLVFCSHNYRASIMLNARNTILTGQLDSKYVLSGLSLAELMEKYSSINKFILDVEKHYDVKLVK